MKDINNRNLRSEASSIGETIRETKYFILQQPDKEIKGKIDNQHNDEEEIYSKTNPKVAIDENCTRKRSSMMMNDDYDKDYNGHFIIKSANTWIEESKIKPVPRMLFDEFWFEGELCILFADSNQGKSILAVQIADSISRGIPIEGFRSDVKAQEVLYFDFELTQKQFESRYSENLKEERKYHNHFIFDEKFKRIEKNPDSYKLEKYDMSDPLVNSIEHLIKENNAKVIIIDNLTYLQDKLEKSDEAAPLIKKLRRVGLQPNSDTKLQKLKCRLLTCNKKMFDYENKNNN